MKTYNSAIRIESFEGMALGNGAALSREDGKAFETHVTKCLDRLKKSGTGRSLIQAMVSTGHVCTIFSAPSGLTKDQNVCTKNPPSIANDIAAMPVSFRPRHKNLLMKQKENATFVADFKDELRTLGELKKKADVSSELVTVLDRAKIKYAEPVKDLPPLLGITSIDLVEMCLGRKAVDDKTFYLISFLLYDYLTPGPGCNTQVRFQPYSSFRRDFGDEFDKMEVGKLDTERGVWRDLMAIILGHELIHAWRIMAGKRVVTSGAWEEEAMTAGVGPFLNWKFTENSLRREYRAPMREKYQSGSCSSDMMNGIMMRMNWGGVVDERY